MSRPTSVPAIELEASHPTKADRRPTAAPKVLRPSAFMRAISGSVVLWGFVLADDACPASSIHRSARRAAWAEESGAGRALIAGGLLLWIPAAFCMAAYSTLKFGRGVARRTAKPLHRQALEQLALALGLGIPPLWYYVFDLHDDEKRRRAAEYLYRFETKAGIYDLLRKHYSSFETTEALRNKAEFARRCAAHGLSVIPVLAVVESDRIRPLDAYPELPRRDLFVKPISGSGGRGAAIWRYRGNGSYESAGVVLDGAALAARLCALAGRGALVLRPCESNHADLARLSPGALSTVRVLTCLDERGQPEVTHAVLRMARRSDSVVDNFHAGGIAAPVALATGILGSATDTGLARDSQFFDCHPLTGAPIRGTVVPHWHDVLDLARRAHAAFADHVAIGWDIAVLDDGPALVEGNKSPDLDIVQRTHAGPIGNSRFGELLAFHLQLASANELPVAPRVGGTASS
jgi:putative polysaccharide biosynthesis protein